ncbi:MAG: 3-carboxy-cis,cis-muconate cycloisomerase [Acidobacteriota bacterium]|nr:3-carboxy-cis,cis-muconate cycloisomerase [Acidobacteriota bacterium]
MDDGLNALLFASPQMREIFCVERQLRCMLQFEWALMAALESHGLAEEGSAAAVAALVDGGFVDREVLRQEAVAAGNVVIPLLRQLQQQLSSTPAARALHLGATSQDVLDTALVLQLREAVAVLQDTARKLEMALTRKVATHARTLLSGRTWLQGAPPTTLGLKLAGTLVALRRHRARLQAAAQGALVLQFGGAVGTLSVLGEHAAGVEADLAQHLQLPVAELPWHTQRDGLVELAATLGVLLGSLGKLARDLALLMQTEVAEVAEAKQAGKGGSSTMPHKQNPVGCAAVLAAATRAPGLVATMLAAMPQEHERGLGNWQAEWETLPELCSLAGMALQRSLEVVEGLQVNAARMRENLDASLGRNMAEAVSAALAARLDRVTAHELVRRATAMSQLRGTPLGEVLQQMPEVTAHLDAEQIHRLLDPENYLGSTARFLARVLGENDADA